MNMHKNARLTPSGRVLLVERTQGGWTVKQASAAAGVSERTAYIWLGRSRWGDRHLADPARLPTTPLIACLHIGLRRQRQTGPDIARATHHAGAI